MADHSLNDPSTRCHAILLSLRDKVHNELRQAKALIQVANGQDFLEFDKIIQHDYLLTLETIILTVIETYGVLDKCLDNH